MSIRRSTALSVLITPTKIPTGGNLFTSAAENGGDNAQYDLQGRAYLSGFRMYIRSSTIASAVKRIAVTVRS